MVAWTRGHSWSRKRSRSSVISALLAPGATNMPRPRRFPPGLHPPAAGRPSAPSAGLSRYSVATWRTDGRASPSFSDAFQHHRHYAVAQLAIDGLGLIPLGVHGGSWSPDPDPGPAAGLDEPRGPHDSDTANWTKHGRLACARCCTTATLVTDEGVDALKASPKATSAAGCTIRPGVSVLISCHAPVSLSRAGVHSLAALWCYI